MKTLVQFGKPIEQPRILEPLRGSFIYGHGKQYQTLVYPDGILPGVRTLEHWPHLRGLMHRRILEVGCSSGMNGILTLVCGAKSYHGYDSDEQALQLGQAVARAWGVDAKLEKEDCGTFVTWPGADVVFLFSVTQRLSLNVLERAVRTSGARTVYLESHGLNDSTAPALMGLLVDFGWKKVAVYDSNGEGWLKELWKGTR